MLCICFSLHSFHSLPAFHHKTNKNFKYDTCSRRQIERQSENEDTAKKNEMNRGILLSELKRARCGVGQRHRALLGITPRVPACIRRRTIFVSSFLGPQKLCTDKNFSPIFGATCANYRVSRNFWCADTIADIQVCLFAV